MINDQVCDYNSGNKLRNCRGYQKVICGQQVESKCRMCFQHIPCGCEVLAKTEYITRYTISCNRSGWRVLTIKWCEH